VVSEATAVVAEMPPVADCQPAPVAWVDWVVADSDRIATGLTAVTESAVAPQTVTVNGSAWNVIAADTVINGAAARLVFVVEATPKAFSRTIVVERALWGTLEPVWSNVDWDSETVAVAQSAAATAVSCLDIT
jgi:hypothetical protein